jgi:serine phosphatase RsbU (regulator of sigma subunit)
VGGDRARTAEGCAGRAAAARLASVCSVDDARAALLADAHLAGSHELPALAQRHVAAFGGTDAQCYLSDLQQITLVPFLGPEGPAIGQHIESLAIDTTLGGRAFSHMQVLVQQHAHSGDAATVWLPLLDGAERLGVLAVSVEATESVDRLREFASLLAQLIMTKRMYGDTIVRLQRQSQMGLAAEMQWSLLPPLTFASREVSVAAAIEPAYEVAGDTVDYAVDAGLARVAVFDGMGHGLPSAQLAAMSVSSYRHARRAARSLIDTCREIDQSLRDMFQGASFTTAVLAELDTQAGTLSWVNAGHPEPLLLRRGRLVKSLHVRPRPPLGLDLTGTDARAEAEVGIEQLEPGDCVLFYTDGVTDARSPDGDFFGEQRLVDLIVRNLAAGLPPSETMRRVVRALLQHQQGRLSDDASLMLLQWPTVRTSRTQTGDGGDETRR